MIGTPDPTKRIPKSLGTDTQLLGNYTLADLAVGGLPSVLVILVTQLLVPQSADIVGVPVSTLTIPFAVVALAVGAILVYLTPEYTDSLAWIALFARFHSRQSQLSHDEVKSELEIERVYPRHDAVERADGAFLRALNVSSSTTILATDEEWADRADAFQDFVNTTVEFPIQIYSTTRSFPAEEYLDHYRDRLDDPDVESNDKLRALVEHYLDWYERELADRQMTIRDHYVVVSVHPEDVHYERDSPLQRLADLPVVGFVLDICSAPPAAEERAMMLDELTDRYRRIDRGIRTIEGCDTRPVEAREFVTLLAEYWAGSEVEYGDPEQVVRNVPIVSDSDDSRQNPLQ